MSVHKTPTGTWKVRWREHGKARARTFPTKADASAFDVEVKRANRLGTLHAVTGQSRTLDEFVTESWAPDRTPELASATRTFYAQLYRVHLAPTFADVPLRKITAPMVAEWRRNRQRDGAGVKALREAHSLLGGILGYACELGELEHNAARAVRPTRRQRPEAVVPMPPSQIEAVRAQLDHRDRTLVSVLAYAGLRPGEALALRWADVREDTLLIARACDLDAGAMKGTKTGNHRTVKLLPPLAADIAEWRLASGRPDATAELFPAPVGAWTKTDWQNWRVRSWHKALSAAGLPRVRPYSCRHTFASLLLAEGRSVHYVARQIGDGPEQVLRTYGHVLDEFAERTDVIAEDEIRLARGQNPTPSVREVSAATGTPTTWRTP